MVTRLYIMMAPNVDGYALALKARGGTLSLRDPDGFNLTFFHELGN